MIGALGFTTPALLLALLALPVLWLILRAVPPSPARRLFPGVVLLLGLKDDDTVTDRTPWWLLLLRLLAVAAIIIGLAGPVLNPEKQTVGNGPLLIVMDASWASAQSWRARLQSLDAIIAQAGRDGRRVAAVRLSTPEQPVFQSAETLRARIAGMGPDPWAPSENTMREFSNLLGEETFETIWMSDALDRAGRAQLLAALEKHGAVRVIETTRAVLGLLPASFADGAVQLIAQRSRAGIAADIVVQAHGRDPAGTMRVLGVLPLQFDADATVASGALSLPSELRARVTRFEIKGAHSAGAVALSDDSLRRREVALIAGRDDREGLELLSPLYYLNRALAPSTDLLDGALMDILPANPDVIILADVAILADAEQSALLEWVDAGGLLVRFAGPRLAASPISRKEEHPLMPVRLRSGGRSVGGAMSWGAPKALAPFSETSPFFGLAIASDVTVSSQVVAQPDPTLAARVIAQLSDGTPLVTRKTIGAGQVVLFHVTANAEWSSLPLSGLFVEMLARLAVSSSTATPDAADLAGTTWQPIRVLSGFGALEDGSTLPGVKGEDLLKSPLGPTLRPGVYAGESRTLARNINLAGEAFAATNWPSHISVEGITRASQTPLTGILLALAMVLLAADVIASLALSGKFRLAPAIIVLLALLAPEKPAMAQTLDDEAAVNATAELVLAHVLTGNQALDDTANAGLLGLSEVLFFRTSVEPANPIGVNLETDDIGYYPLLYWPITPEQPRPSQEAYAKLNQYLRSGGMILFDTRDAGIARFGGSSPNGRALQSLAAPLDIPRLEPVPEDHVLTRAFYLLQDFPGRYARGALWVEAAPPDAEKIEGMPFRNLNDGVTPVVIGGNDWASAWAVDARGNNLFPVGRGFGGERQREMAYRFGVNLVMYVLSGNYKSDQVHVPALLERLGQ
ncbi:MAG: DUF4159 domain-containing protein [Rhodobacterales bacterium]|nr:DUF4159 domain-containing protein [Rhodobacterales bacterium]